MGNVKEISDADFETEVIKAPVPVLVDFWAPWCGPCRAIAPIIEELSGELGGKVKVLKMNVDDNPQTPGQLGVRSIPTLKVFINGAEDRQMVGAASKEQIEDFLSPYC